MSGNTGSVIIRHRRSCGNNDANTVIVFEIWSCWWQAELSHGLMDCVLSRNMTFSCLSLLSSLFSFYHSGWITEIFVRRFLDINGSRINLDILSSFNLYFSYKVENSTLSLFFFSLVCTHLGYLRTRITGNDQTSLFHLILISLSFTFILFIGNYYFIWLVSMNMYIKYIIFMYIQLLFGPTAWLLYTSPPFPTVIHIRLISLSSHILFFAISFYFYWANVCGNLLMFPSFYSCNWQAANYGTLNH